MDLLNEEQLSVANKILSTTDNYFITGVGGSGKCHGIDTPVIMYDGTIKMIQDIKVGEKVMGDNSASRNVLSTTEGVGVAVGMVTDSGSYALVSYVYDEFWKYPPIITTSAISIVI